MSHLLSGLTEHWMLRIVSDLKKGISFEKATEFLSNEVDPAAIERNKEFLINRANDQLEAEKPPQAKIETPKKK